MAFEGIESVSYQVHGLLHLTDDAVRLEWTGTRSVEQVSLDRVGTDVQELPEEWLEVPYDRLAGAWVIGGWWWPQLELRAHSPEDFIDMPATRGVTLRLRLRRGDRDLAREIASEINTHLTTATGNHP
jgi:hypothetical protein